MVDGHNRPPLADVDEDVTSVAARNPRTVAAHPSADATSCLPPPGTPPVLEALPTRTMLDGRYQLLSVIRARGPVTLWRGDDRILARPVAVRVVQHAGADDPAAAGRERAAQMLLSAAIGSGRLVHPGAASTYDATSTTTDAGRVSYVVSEWVDGTSLQTLSEQGPLRPDQAATVLLAVARVLTAAHQRDIHHGDLRASDVIISGHGMVKVVDLGTGSVVAALEKGAHSQAEPWADSADLDADDVRAMGGLLYAALTGRWPLERECGLPPAPTTSDGRPCSPRQVRAGVPRDLDAVTLATLGDDRVNRPPITTAAELANALEELAPPDGTLDLGRVRIDDEPPMTRAMAAGTSTAGYAADGFRPGTAAYDMGGSGAYPNSGAYPPGGGYPDNGSPRPPTQQHRPQRPNRAQHAPYGQGPSPITRRRWLIAVAVLVATALIAVAVVVLTRGDAKSAAPSPPSTSATTPVGTTMKPQTVTAFDPPPGDGDENNGDTAKAVDGDPSTAWTTQGYNNTDGRQFGGLKSGVGLRVDFSKPVTVRQINITFGGSGTSFELRAGDTEVNDVNAYKVVVPETTAATATATTVSVPSTAGAHQYWVVWLTKLPTAQDGRFKGSIVDMSFHS
ncbi:protein kinase family protein [Frankia sp. Cppng1_Ct_nod]|uniref:protein kinase family protein n=1 Tax=Frankia sp. Cppng1_Ct_nod TaxID=2897162 RepID=UPI0010416029|nr:protein kinase family protein [Frankia sp. Cppng1_Ct_nod]